MKRCYIFVIILWLSLLLLGCGKEEEEATEAAYIPPFVISHVSLEGSTEDLCTAIETIKCHITSVSIDKYSDGSLTAYIYSFYMPNIYVPEFTGTPGYKYIMPYETRYSLLLFENVDRGEGNRNLYITYDRVTDDFDIVLDSNNNGNPWDGEDEVVLELTPES